MIVYIVILITRFCTKTTKKEKDMERERFDEIIDADEDSSIDYKENRVLLGLKIIAKYIPNNCVAGADHDIIYSASVDELLEAGLTEDDAVELSNLGWHIAYDCLSHFV